MRLRLSALVLLAVATITSPTLAQGPVLSPAARAAAERIAAPQLAWDVAQLASDDLKGRNTPSPGFDAAADYLIARLQRAGLAPAGDRGGFRQYYDLDDTRLEASRASLTIGTRRFDVGKDIAMRTLGVPRSGTVPVVYVGHGWTVPDRGIDAFAGVDVKGALVVAHGPRVMPAGVSISQVGRVTVGARTVMDEAARRGAVGVLFITQASELLRWDDLRSAGQVRREMVPNVPSAYATPDIPSLLLSPDTTRALLEGEAAARAAARVASGDTGGDIDASALGLVAGIPEAMTRAARRRDRDTLLALDDAFHAALWHLAGSPTLEEVLQNLRARITPIIRQSLALMPDDELARMGEWHAELLAAVHEGPRPARSAAARHTDLTRARVLAETGDDT